MMKACKFIKTGQDWYIDLPEFIEQGGSVGDLQMIDGADKMLDIMAGNENSVIVFVAREQFEGADILVLTEKCDPYIGDRYYRMNTKDKKLSDNVAVPGYRICIRRHPSTNLCDKTKALTN